MGVCYPRSGTPFSVPGLISFNEVHAEQDLEPIYFEGRKAGFVPPSKTFVPTLTMLGVQYPFTKLLGIAELRNGFYVTGQRPVMFDFCYRTELDQSKYRIHVVYGIVATEKMVKAKTTSNKVDYNPRPFDLSCTPYPGYSAHLFADSSKADLTVLENALYGTSSADPRCPLPSEMVGLV